MKCPSCYRKHVSIWTSTNIRSIPSGVIVECNNCRREVKIVLNAETSVLIDLIYDAISIYKSSLR